MVAEGHFRKEREAPLKVKGRRRTLSGPSLDQERRELGPDYQDHVVLFCWQDGRPPHPDTITRRFKQLAAAAGLAQIDLHDVRHSYATAGRDAKIDWKALSQRIGHADVAFTMKQYVQTDLEADRQVANTLAELIIGGGLASLEVRTTEGAA
jgi:integrase